MDRTKIQSVYEERKSDFENLLGRQKRLLTFISILRLVLFVGSIYFIVLSISTGYNILLLPAGLMVVLFFLFVSYHKNQTDKRKLLSELIWINREEIDALHDKFSGFDDGQRFTNPDHPWSYDLDLFGERSLFQYINRTATHTGPRKLADYLCTPVTEESEIKNRQEVSRELTEKLNLRQHFAANARLMEKEEQDFDEVIRWSGKTAFIEKYRWTKVMAVVMTVVASGIIIAGIINPAFFRLLIPVVLLNLSLLSSFVARTNRYQEQVSKKHSFLRTYSVLLEILAGEEFKHPELTGIKEQCRNASKSIQKLSELLNLFDQRLNLLVGFVLNALVLFDFHMLHRLAAWNREHQADFENWMEITGRCDALFSLAGFAYNHPGYKYPVIEKEITGLTAKSMGHPMIPSEKRVDNSIVINQERVVLITGANMAGKSTFLRAVGVNMVLAYAGCPVCAASFVTGPYRLYSSMRTSDSLKDEESYFFAEIKRLKKIVDCMKEGENLLILLDEVLKGTNTTDKQKGSKGLIEKSIAHEVLCFIATHDLSLGEMQEQHKGKIVNYCFESYIRDLELTFDYKMRPGLAKNMNASFLMKQMGIMD
jgi:ABC-type multidrug transport system fused ATPase/permease subunit